MRGTGAAASVGVMAGTIANTPSCWTRRLAIVRSWFGSSPSLLHSPEKSYLRPNVPPLRSRRRSAPARPTAEVPKFGSQIPATLIDVLVTPRASDWAATFAPATSTDASATVRDHRCRDRNDGHQLLSFHRFPLVVPSTVSSVADCPHTGTRSSPLAQVRGCAPRRFAWISFGRPTASTRPRSSTTMRSHCSMTKPTSCSTSTTAHDPSALIAWIRSPRRAASVSSRPDVGSSRSRTRRRIDDRARELDHPREPDRQRPGRLLAHGREPALLEHLVRSRARRCFSRLRRVGEDTRSASSPAAAAAPFERGQHVVLDARASRTSARAGRCAAGPCGRVVTARDPA